MRRISSIMVLAWSMTTSATAQTEDLQRARELQARIQKQMSEIDELLMPPESAPGSERERIETAVTRHGEVIRGIEELIRLIPHESRGASGGG